MHNVAIVDTETTGSFVSLKMVELAIILVDHDQITKQFTTLINPQSPIDWYAQKVHHIHDSDVALAPRFNDIKDEVATLLENRLLIAHNVAFDYAVLQNEFHLLGEQFTTKTLCTVELSKFLFPNEQKHSLQAIINRYQIRVAHRHRALDDAMVVYQFIRKIQDSFPDEQVIYAWDYVLKRHRKRQLGMSPTLEQTKAFIDQQYDIESIAKERGLSKGTIITHIEKLSKIFHDLDITYLQPNTDFITQLKTLHLSKRHIKEIKIQLGDKVSYEDIRLGLLFI